MKKIQILIVLLLIAVSSHGQEEKKLYPELELIKDKVTLNDEQKKNVSTTFDQEEDYKNQVIEETYINHYKKTFLSTQDLNKELYTTELEERAEDPLIKKDTQSFNLPADILKTSETKGGDGTYVNKSDSLVLVALYDSTNGPNWTDNTNWLTGPVNSWTGITVSSGVITAINLENNNLSGTIPSELGNLTSLQELWLGYNNLSGPIPPELGNLTSLTYLVLWYNYNLSGTIPSELGNLSSLQFLILDGNQLSGTIPSSLGNLTSLVYLWLDQNQLTGSIPAELGDLTNLNNLHLGYNQLTGSIPASIGNLTNLVSLGLYNNQLTEIPPEIGNLIQLSDLNICENQLTGDIPTTIGNLNNLLYLNLSDNQLSGDIPSTIGNMSSLQQLYMFNNQLTGSILDYLVNLTNLNIIHLGNNQLSGSIPAAIDNLYNLTELALYDNQLTGNIPTSIDNLTNLTSLNLGDNQLSGEIPSELGNMTNLQSLWLYGNQLTGNIPTSIVNLTNLMQLGLGGNQLTGNIPTSIGSLINLTNLDLQYNQLSGEIPTGIGNLTNLTYLDLGLNQLSGSIPTEIGNLTNLTSLDLQNNQLTGNIPAEIGGLANLTALRLDNNQFTGMGDLSSLNCSPEIYNNYLTFDAIKPNIGLFTVHDQYSPQYVPIDTNIFLEPVGTKVTLNIDTLAEVNLGGENNYYQWFKDEGNVTEITTNPEYIIDSLDTSTEGIYYCEITNTEVDSLILISKNVYVNINVSSTDFDALVALYNATDGDNWTDNSGWNTTTNNVSNAWHGVTVSGGHVTELNLTSNNLTGTIPPEIGDLLYLTKLELYYNNLEGEIPTEIGNLTNLTLMDLDGNQLSGSIPPEIGNLTNLTNLFIDANNITGSIPSEIGNLINLTYLWLHSNQISGEIPSEIGSLTNLTSLALVNNQLTGSIPIELGNLANLQELWLYNNQLSGELPSELGNLSNLRRFRLERNQFTGNIPVELGNLTNLTGLALIDNQLTGSIPAEISNLTNLTGLWLYNNQFTGMEVLTAASCSPQVYNNYLTFAALEPNIAFFASSDYYSPQYAVPVNTSQIEEPAGATVILNIDTLTDVNLGGANNRYQWFKDSVSVTEISSSPEYVISSLDASGEGDYYCEITNIAVPELTLSTEKVSVNIPISSTEFDALVALYNATDGDNWNNNSGWNTTTNNVSNDWYGVTVSGGHVVELILTDNNLAGTIPPEIGNLTHLTYLDLGRNQLTGSIPAEIYNLTNVVTLYIHTNPLSGEIPAGIDNMTSLERLSFSNNKLTGEIPPEIGNLTHLTYLSIYNNQLSGSIPTEIGNLTNLTNLYLHINQLTGSIPAEIGNLINLTALRLDYNQLTGNIPTEISNLTHLTQLILRFNQLSGNIPAGIGNLTNLEYIWLMNNQLSGIIPAAIANSPSLISLYLNDNQFTGMEDLTAANSSPNVNNNYLTFAAIEPNIGLFTDINQYNPQYAVPLNKKQIEEPAGATVILNIDTLTDVNLGGTSNRYQWFQDGNPVTEITASPDYAIDALDFEDQGLYYCQITNTAVDGLTLETEKVLVKISCNTCPETPASNFHEIATSAHALEVGWTSGSDNVLVVMRRDEVIEQDPITGITYNADPVYGNGDDIGDAFVVFNGTGESVNLTELWPGTTYHFAVYKYNDADKCYSSEALTDSLQTQGCRPEYSTGSILSDYIESVVLGDIHNVSGPSDAPFYDYYSNMSTDITKTSTYQIQITCGNYGGDYYAAWIDYNHDNNFSASEKLGEFKTTEAFETRTIEFNVPADAVTGITDLRVKAAYQGENMDACADYGFGETEDYPIHVLPPPSYDVTFNVSDGTNPIEGAAVSYNETVQNTDAAGIAVFTDVLVGTSAYTITKTGFHDSNGSIDVVDGDVIENVVILDLRVAIDVLVTNITGNSADVNWTGSGADNYQIRYYETGTTNYQYIYSLSSPTAISVSPSTSYDVQVRSKIGGEWSSYSTAATFTSLEEQMVVSITNIGSNTADVNWTGSGADNYQIRYYE
ncbi:MAG: leucine-rich repeat domain-containing protein, partial [Bacteroidetes bacterium]|nr:leucine-rich repeat domain-containing protein [Bacteroidota bacterium]